MSNIFLLENQRIREACSQMADVSFSERSIILKSIQLMASTPSWDRCMYFRADKIHFEMLAWYIWQMRICSYTDVVTFTFTTLVVFVLWAGSYVIIRFLESSYTCFRD